MKVGTMLPTYSSGDYTVSSEVLKNWARESEQAGFDSLWVIDHLVQPFTYKTSALDPLTALTYAAGVTESIDLGTSILILPIRKTAVAAHQAHTIQHLAGGNLTLGLGAGYDNTEFEVTNVPKFERGPRLSEQVDVLNDLFDGKTSYDGRFHSFEDVTVDPVPNNPPRLLPGGESKVDDDDGTRWIPEPILKRIMNGDGWIAAPSHPEKLTAEHELVMDYAAEFGRDPNSLDTVCLNYTHLVEDESNEEAIRDRQREVFENLYSPAVGIEFAERNCLFGSIDEILATIDRYREIGFDEVIVGPAAREDISLRRQHEILRDRLLPRVS
jgi:alkanesulfonate monooxygenase